MLKILITTVHGWTGQQCLEIVWHTALVLGIFVDTFFPIIISIMGTSEVHTTVVSSENNNKIYYSMTVQYSTYHDVVSFNKEKK
jgi:hypothetical protein